MKQTYHWVAVNPNTGYYIITVYKNNWFVEVNFGLSADILEAFKLVR